MNPVNRILVIASIIIISMSASAKDHEEELRDIATYQGYINLMQGYYDAIITTHNISDDAEVAAVFQMQKIGDFHKESGNVEKAIEIYESLLEQTENQTIRNAAYHMLSERYREMGKYKEAVDVLQKGLKENLRLIK